MKVARSPLRRWRREVGMTQERLAELADVSQAHISHVEKGQAPIEGSLKQYLDEVASLCAEQRAFIESLKHTEDALVE